jgi:hypothetical protein
VLFLGPSLTFMVVYLWGRRNRFIRLSLLGFTFTAPYLPWVLLGLSLLLGHSVLSDTLGICAGHLYYYLEDFYPSISGRRLLKTPILLLCLSRPSRKILDTLFFLMQQMASRGHQRGAGISWRGHRESRGRAPPPGRLRLGRERKAGRWPELP